MRDTDAALVRSESRGENREPAPAHRGPNAVPRARARTPVPPKRATAADIERLNKEYALAMKNHREKLARLRLEQLAKAKLPEPRPNTPTVAIDLEYVPMGSGKSRRTSLAGITSVASPGAKTASGVEEDEEEEEEETVAGNREGRVGILRVTVNRAVNVRKADNAKQPQPVCVAQISGQSSSPRRPWTRPTSRCGTRLFSSSTCRIATRFR